MDKKAATRVAAFLLSSGDIKTGNNDISARNADNFIPGVMRGKDMISILYGLVTGSLASRHWTGYH